MRVQKKKFIIFRKEGKDALLFNPISSDIMVINESGCLIWHFLDKARTVEALVERICAVYKADKAKASKDVKIFIKTLKKNNLLNTIHA